MSREYFQEARDIMGRTDRKLKAHVPVQPVVIIKNKETLWEKEMREGLINRVLFDQNERKRTR